MKKYQNYTVGSKYFILTEYTPASVWQTTVFPVDDLTGHIEFTLPKEQIIHSSEASALSHHQKSVYYWSGNISPEDIIGIGEGFY